MQRLHEEGFTLLQHSQDHAECGGHETGEVDHRCYVWTMFEEDGAWTKNF